MRENDTPSSALRSAIYYKIRWDECSAPYDASKVKGRSRPITVRKVMDVLSSISSALACLEELRIMRHFQQQGAQHILYMYTVLRPPSKNGYSHVLIVEEHTSTSLDQIIALDMAPDAASVLGWSRQMLVALQHVHASGIVHTAIEPRHLLLTPQGMIKVSQRSYSVIASVTVAAKAFFQALIELV
jgi:serine/threonine protein kinase